MKTLTMYALLFVAMVSITACGSKEYDSAQSDEETASQETTEPRQE